MELPGAVWRALPGELGLWVLEWRNVEKNTHGFWVARHNSASVCARTAEGEATDWWTSLVGVSSTHFFLHAYRNPDIPEPTDLLAFDLDTGAFCWALGGVRFAGFSADGQPIVAQKSGLNLTYRACDEASGDLRQETRLELPLNEKGWREADCYRQGDEHYDLLKQTLEKHTQLCPSGSIEYLDYADKMAFSFYLYRDDSMVQYLAVLNRFMKVEYLEVVETNLEKEGKSGLLLKESWLYFVKNKNIFVGINLEG